jgi:hypothetical protein
MNAEWGLLLGGGGASSNAAWAKYAESPTQVTTPVHTQEAHEGASDAFGSSVTIFGMCHVVTKQHVSSRIDQYGTKLPAVFPRVFRLKIRRHVLWAILERQDRTTCCCPVAVVSGNK